MNKRTTYFKNQKIETRENEGKKYIRGIIPYESKSTALNETIARSAFTKSIKEQDIKALVNHNTDMVLGSTRSGTMVLENTDEGLNFEIQLGNQSFAQDAFETVARGDASGVSFGFQPVKVTRSGQASVLQEVKLFEISPICTFPAYEESNAMAQVRTILEKREIDLDVLTAILAKDNLESGDEEIIAQIIGELQKLAPTSQEEKKVEEKVEEKPAAEVPPSDDTGVAEALDALKLALEMEIEQSI